MTSAVTRPSFAVIAVVAVIVGVMFKLFGAIGLRLVCINNQGNLVNNAGSKVGRRVMKISIDVLG